MNKALLKDVESLAKKFTRESTEMGDKSQKARHVIIGVLQGMEDEKEQTELVSKLTEHEGGTAEDLSRLILSFFMEKNRQLKATRKLATDVISGIHDKGNA